VEQLEDPAQRSALRLEYATLGWNGTEAAITIALGIAAGSLALVGFGVDSLVELFASLVVVWHLRPGGSDHDVERRTEVALRLIAVAFAVLGLVLGLGAVANLIGEHRPEESGWGIAYLAVTVVVMLTLGVLKRRVAEQMGSAPLRSEATVSLLDAGLAAATLVGLALNAMLDWWWADPLAALLIAVVAWREARENWLEAGESDA
jgi:divalent metal cation (Fe/Co/Zn/Cd) transporter